MTPLKDQLIVYFIKEFSDLPDRSGYSTTKWLDGADYPKDLVNTIFIGSIVNSSPYKKDRVAASYNILAHEMYHIFTREGQHYNLPQANISNIWQTRSDLILPQTCEKVSSLDLIANLLKASKNSLSSIKQEH